MKQENDGARKLEAEIKALRQRNTELEQTQSRLRYVAEALQESEARYEAIVEAFDGLIYICSPKYQVEFMNAQFIRRTGYNAVGEKCYRALHNLDDICPWCVNEHVQRGETMRWEVRSPKDGRWYYVVNTPLRRPDGTISKMAMIQDITERKTAEEALRRNQDMLNNILASSPMGIAYFEDGKLKWCNQALASIFLEAQQENLIGKSSRDFCSSEDECQRLRQMFYDALSEGKPAAADVSLRRGDGSVFFGHVKLCSFDSTRPEKGIIVTISDISDRKRAEKELRTRTADLERSNKDLEQFAYVAAHDLREPLLAVSAYLKVLERRYNNKLESGARKLIGSAVDAAMRMDTLIQCLLAYSRLASDIPLLEPVDLETVLDTAQANLQPVIEGSGAAVSRDPLPIVPGNAPQLVQLFQNLIGNAIKFCGDKAPEIRVSAIRESAEWQISVRDNGIGIEPPFFERIFLIFQRLHTGMEYPGTGIGLANCRKIVERHGGRIWVESEPGKGSTFFFTLPALAAPTD